MKASRRLSIMMLMVQARGWVTAPAMPRALEVSQRPHPLRRIERIIRNGPKRCRLPDLHAPAGLLGGVFALCCCRVGRLMPATAIRDQN